MTYSLSACPQKNIKISGLRDLLAQYDVFLIDVTGVVHDGLKPYDGAISCLNRLIAEKRVVFFSNNPRPGDLLQQKLQSFGIQGNFQCFTSGDATRLFLKDQKEKKIFHIGSERNQDILRDLNIKTTSSLEKADLVLLTAFLEEEENIAQYDDIFKKIVQKGLPVLCANPDKVAIHGKHIRRCAGTLAERLESMGGKVTYLGKPSLDFYTLFHKRFPFAKNKSIMIGDTIETDILGAQQFHIDSVLVLTGNTQTELQKMGNSLEDFMKNKTVQPSFHLSRLSW